MQFQANVLLLVNITVCVLHVYDCHTEKKPIPKVLMISFDGFRWDYLHRPGILKGALHNFEKFVTQGVYAKNGLTNAFITKTLPNHYTLVTGLWEESHGLIANVMYDPVLNRTFDYENLAQQTDSAWFDNGAEPIWVTNQLKSNSHRSGSMMWPGSLAVVKGIMPTEYVALDLKMKNETKIDTVVEWFTMQNPVNLGLLYFDEPDEISHTYGPMTPPVDRMIEALDGLIGYLLNRFKEKNLLGEIDIIITSDHGFASTPPDKIIDLYEIIDPSSCTEFQTSPVVNLLPNPGKEDEIYSALKKASENKNFTVYWKKDIPERFHYKNNRRVQPILVVADEHYSIKTKWAMPLGDHGWDNKLKDMHPFFIAMGPSFKSNFAVDTFKSVDIYPLLCHLLQLEPAPNNGSFDRVKDLLKDSMEVQTTWATFGTYIFVLVLIALVGGVFMVAACRVHRYMKRKQMYSLSGLPHSVKFSVKSGNGAKLPLLSDSEDDFP